MNKELIDRMRRDFDSLAQTLPTDGSIEFWFARDLQEPLGYARWENFLTAIHRAIESCESTGYQSSDHFRGVTKLIPVEDDGYRFLGLTCAETDSSAKSLHRPALGWQGAAA
ncbi:MAG: hypothetical protein ABIS50_10725 [Luteolibacter sp.]|uniref:hypothetical protein n=1 Tax=Luteolibacter sp. TaxID=1962973 RepID=UPI0032656D81